MTLTMWQLIRYVISSTYTYSIKPVVYRISKESAQIHHFPVNCTDKCREIIYDGGHELMVPNINNLYKVSI